MYVDIVILNAFNLNKLFFFFSFFLSSCHQGEELLCGGFHSSSLNGGNCSVATDLTFFPTLFQCTRRCHFCFKFKLLMHIKVRPNNTMPNYNNIEGPECTSVTKITEALLL